MCPIAPLFKSNLSLVTTGCPRALSHVLHDTPFPLPILLDNFHWFSNDTHPCLSINSHFSPPNSSHYINKMELTPAPVQTSSLSIPFCSLRFAFLVPSAHLSIMRIKSFHPDLLNINSQSFNPNTPLQNCLFTSEW